MPPPPIASPVLTRRAGSEKSKATNRTSNSGNARTLVAKTPVNRKTDPNLPETATTTYIQGFTELVHDLKRIREKATAPQYPFKSYEEALIRACALACPTLRDVSRLQARYVILKSSLYWKNVLHYNQFTERVNIGWSVSKCVTDYCGEAGPPTPFVQINQFLLHQYVSRIKKPTSYGSLKRANESIIFGVDDSETVRYYFKCNRVILVSIVLGTSPTRFEQSLKLALLPCLIQNAIWSNVTPFAALGVRRLREQHSAANTVDCYKKQYTVSCKLIEPDEQTLIRHSDAVDLWTILVKHKALLVCDDIGAYVACLSPGGICRFMGNFKTLDTNFVNCIRSETQIGFTVGQLEFQKPRTFSSEHVILRALATAACTAGSVLAVTHIRPWLANIFDNYLISGGAIALQYLISTANVYVEGYVSSEKLTKSFNFLREWCTMQNITCAVGCYLVYSTFARVYNAVCRFGQIKPFENVWYTVLCVLKFLAAAGTLQYAHPLIGEISTTTQLILSALFAADCLVPLCRQMYALVKLNIAVFTSTVSLFETGLALSPRFCDMLLCAAIASAFAYQLEYGSQEAANITAAFGNENDPSGVEGVVSIMMQAASQLGPLGAFAGYYYGLPPSIVPIPVEALTADDFARDVCLCAVNWNQTDRKLSDDDKKRIGNMYTSWEEAEYDAVIYTATDRQCGSINAAATEDCFDAIWTKNHSYATQLVEQTFNTFTTGEDIHKQAIAFAKSVPNETADDVASRAVLEAQYWDVAYSKYAMSTSGVGQAIEIASVATLVSSVKATFAAFQHTSTLLFGESMTDTLLPTIDTDTFEIVDKITTMIQSFEQFIDRIVVIVYDMLDTIEALADSDLVRTLKYNAGNELTKLAKTVTQVLPTNMVGMLAPLIQKLGIDEYTGPMNDVKSFVRDKIVNVQEELYILQGRVRSTLKTIRADAYYAFDDIKHQIENAGNTAARYIYITEHRAKQWIKIPQLVAVYALPPYSKRGIEFSFQLYQRYVGHHDGPGPNSAIVNARKAIDLQNKTQNCTANDGNVFDSFSTLLGEVNASTQTTDAAACSGAW